MKLLGSLWERLILRTEHSSFRLNRWTGIAQYHDPARYLNVAREQLFAYCLAVEKDLFAYLRPPDTDVPYERVSRSVASVAGKRAGAARTHETLAFSSPIPSGIEPNDTVLVHRYRAHAASQGTILFHHPAFRSGLAWIEWFTRPLRERFDVAVMEVPYHLSRAPEGTFSGERLINPNPIYLYEGLRQWMADQRALLAILESEAADGDPGARPVALVGYSLGAYLSMLYTRFDPALPVVAICGTNDYTLGVFEGILTTSLRACIESAGISRDDWERLTRTLKLHQHAHELPADRFLLLSARYDRVEPFPSIERLIEALRPRRSVILPSGHSTTAILFRRRIMKEALSFIDELSGEVRRDRGARGDAGRRLDGGLTPPRPRLSS